MTNATTNERTNATGVGNMTSPGAGASTGTTNTGSVSGTTNTVPATGTPVGAAAGDVSVGAGGPATSGSASDDDTSGSSVVADAGADAGDAGQDVPGEVDELDEADAAAPTDAGAVDAGADLAAALADGQILTVVDALNASEVEQARAVLPRLQSDAVRAFAQIMIEEHQAAREALTTLAAEQQIAAEGSDIAEQLRAESQQVQSELGATDAAQLDTAYLDAQVAAHSEAEALLADLSAAADSLALAAQLSQLRLNVQGHLQSAAALRASLQEGAAL
jgi:putative membrane protein